MLVYLLVHLCVTNQYIQLSYNELSSRLPTKGNYGNCQQSLDTRMLAVPWLLHFVDMFGFPYLHENQSVIFPFFWVQNNCNCNSFDSP